MWVLISFIKKYTSFYKNEKLTSGFYEKVLMKVHRGNFKT